MKRMTGLLVVMLGALLTAGCFQVERVVTVRPDGSGTVEETIMFSKKALRGITEAFQPEGEGKAPEDLDLFKEKDLRESAPKMGKGVRFVSSSRISDENFTGYRAIYAFKNINRLQMDSGPPSLDKKPGSAKPDQGTTFSFKPGKSGNPATLVITSSKEKSKVGAKAQAVTEEIKQTDQNEPSDQDLKMLKEFLDGMRFSLSVVFDGNIIDTNATHRENSRVILAEVDFSKFFSLSQQDLAKLYEVKNADMASAFAVLKNVPGVKIDLNDKVWVTFRKSR